MLIVVGVALDTMRQMESQMMMRSYEGFLRVNLLVLGPQGAGKGTQAKRISREYGIPHVSTGDMFRAEQEAGTEFGTRVGEIMATGQLVPDELTIAMIEERLGAATTPRDGFVLDGFPRNLAQAEALDAMLGGIGRGLDAILFFDIPDEVGMERALRRAEIENRLDDTPRGDREAARDLPLARPSRSSSTTGRPASSCRCTGSGRSTRSGPRSPTALEQAAPWKARMIIRKSEAEIETMARAGRVVADTLALLEEHIQPGRHDRRARRARRGVHPLAAAACRRSRATRATRPPPASRRTTWSCTASRARRGSPTATSSRSTSA